MDKRAKKKHKKKLKRSKKQYNANKLSPRELEIQGKRYLLIKRKQRIEEEIASLTDKKKIKELTEEIEKIDKELEDQFFEIVSRL